jgi:hypothetical protein
MPDDPRVLGRVRRCSDHPLALALQLTIQRGNEQRQVTATLGERPVSPVH